VAEHVLTDLSIAELGALIKAKEVSPVEAVEASIQRTDAMDSKIGAFITPTPEPARAAAKVAEQEIMAGRYRGPLHGVPFALKDLYWTKGIRTASGSRVDADFVPAEDGTVVSRLYEAGAIPMGKVHLSEFAFDGLGVNKHYGTPRNPWNTNHVAGGSSSGSASSVAAGMVPFAMGTDTGGSVRLPASFCGITGHKPSFGLVSRHGITPLSWSMDHPGPLVRTVEDAALVMNAITGHDPQDASSADIGARDFTRYLGKGAQGLRVGVPQEFIWDIIDPEVKAAVEAAIQHLGSLGATVTPIALPELSHAGPIFGLTIASEAATYHREKILAHGDLYDPSIRIRIEGGLFISAAAYLHAQRAREAYRRAVATAMADVDVLAVPTVVVPSPAVGQDRVTIDGVEHPLRLTILRASQAFSLIGLPAMSVPCGFTNGGLPIGMQLVGKPFTDDIVMGAANTYQQSTDWHLRKPPLD
jgi:aspartyl-tRNA(Asn)/glutamyl-tRNA(Gln) amidotransferase subunit A